MANEETDCQTYIRYFYKLAPRLAVSSENGLNRGRKRHEEIVSSRRNLFLRKSKIFFGLNTCYSDKKNYQRHNLNTVIIVNIIARCYICSKYKFKKHLLYQIQNLAGTKRIHDS